MALLVEKGMNELIARRRQVTMVRFERRCEPKVLAALRAQERVAIAMGAVPSGAYTQWAAELYKAQLADAMMSAHFGYAEATMKEPDAQIGFGDPDEFLRRPYAVNVQNYLQTVSRQQAKTHANVIQNILTAQAASGVGYDPKDLARQLQPWGKTYANAVARSTVVWANNEGAMQQYKKSGVTSQEWHATEDELVCPFCAAMHGRVIPVEGTFASAGSPVIGTNSKTFVVGPMNVQHPPLHPNCVLESTRVWAPDYCAALVATYCGPVVHLTAANGARVSVTPNHMFLTLRGWVPAHELRQGDDMVYGCIGERMLGVNEDEHGRPAFAQDVIKALAHTGPRARAVPSAAYLHGDASFVDGDIDIVATDALLRGDVQPFGYDIEREAFFLRGTEHLEALARRGNPNSMLVALALASDCIVSRNGVPGVLLRGACAHHQAVGFGIVAARNADSAQAPGNHATINIEVLRKLVLRLSSNVTTTKLLQVDLDLSHGSSPIKVYDFSTSSTLYTANGFLTSNCRCVLLPVIDVENDPDLQLALEPEPMPPPPLPTPQPTQVQPSLVPTPSAPRVTSTMRGQDVANEISTWGAAVKEEEKRLIAREVAALTERERTLEAIMQKHRLSTGEAVMHPEYQLWKQRNLEPLMKEREALDVVLRDRVGAVHKSLQVPASERTAMPYKIAKGKVAASQKDAIREGVRFVQSIARRDAFGSQAKEVPIKCYGRRGRSDCSRTLGISFRSNEARVVVHEYGHWIEQHTPNFQAKARAFLDRRTQGETAQRLNKLRPGWGYKNYEVAKPDQFFDPYCGKIYATDTEIVSMGLERMYTDPVGFATIDPDYFGFILDLVRGI